MPVLHSDVGSLPLNTISPLDDVQPRSKLRLGGKTTSLRFGKGGELVHGGHQRPVLSDGEVDGTVEGLNLGQKAMSEKSAREQRPKEEANDATDFDLPSDLDPTSRDRASLPVQERFVLSVRHAFPLEGDSAHLHPRPSHLVIPTKLVLLQRLLVLRLEVVVAEVDGKRSEGDGGRLSAVSVLLSRPEGREMIEVGRGKARRREGMWRLQEHVEEGLGVKGFVLVGHLQAEM